MRFDIIDGNNKFWMKNDKTLEDSFYTVKKILNDNALVIDDIKKAVLNYMKICQDNPKSDILII